MNPMSQIPGYTPLIFDHFKYIHTEGEPV